MKSVHTVKRIGYCFFLLCLTLSNAANAQKKDSLLALLKKHEQLDTVRANVLFRLAELYKDENQDSSVFYAGLGRALAVKIGDKPIEANCTELLGLSSLRKNEYEKAIDLYLNAYHIYIQTNNKNKQGQVLRSIADIFYRQLKYKPSLDYYNKSLAVSHEINDHMGMGLSLLSMGGIYFDQGNYPEAITNYFNALKNFDTINDRNGASMTLVNVATVYSTVGNYKLAKEYIDKALAISNGLDQKEVVFSNMVNIGVVYGDMKDYKNALVLFQKGIKLADSLGDRTWKDICLSNIADAYYELGMYDTAYAKYQELLKRPEGLPDTTLYVMGETCIGLVLKQRGQLQEAIKHLTLAYTVARNKDLKKNIFDISASLSEVYELAHNYPKALEFHKIYYDYHDSLNNGKTDKRLQQLHFEYELNKKESEIELLNKNKIIEQDRSQMQQIAIWASLSGLVLVIAICILLYRSSLRERRNKNEILSQKEEILEQSKRLEELNSFKDKTFSVLSHDLRAPLGALTSAMAMLDEKVITPDDFMEVKPEVQSQLSSLNILLDNLLNWAKGHMLGKGTEKPEAINVRSLVEGNIAVTGNIATLKQLKIANNVPAGIRALGYTGQIDIVLRNLLMNAIKFSNPGGKITLDAKLVQGSIHISVRDEGVGMTSEQLEKLFTAAKNNSTFGTTGEKGIGIGLLLCYEFIKANKGDIFVTSEVNGGTTFTITLPVAG